MSSVAVVGLGEMGSRFARRFLDAGHAVVVWNRTRERMKPLVDSGAAAAETPADAARRAQAVVTMVADPHALRAVTEGPGGIAAGIGAGAHIEMSTVGPAAIERLAGALPDEAGLLDAPVLGSIDAAERGDLEIFVGGPEPLAERWMPLLSALGSPRRVGPLGLGAAAKLVANAALLGTLALVGETLALAKATGLARGVAFDVLSETPLAPQADRRRAAVESGQYPLHFALSLARKDADVIAEATELELPLLAAVRSWFDDAERAGFGEHDYSALIATILASAS